jgi:dipeptidase
MCDTIVATGDVTADGVTLFAKNSDREPNEAQQLVWLPAADHAPGGVLQCTYIAIPQAAHTHAVLLSKPFWIWGAEMGVNEHGLAIGNEAVFTRLGYSKEPGLIGMDLLRLALERAADARQAIDLITSLLETYGQGGNCGYQHTFHYHNSFLLADPGAAWVLETAGPHWAAKQVRGVYAISNALSLDADWDLASPGLVETALQRGWCRSRDAFSLRRCYSDRLYTTLSDARCRRARTTALLQGQAGRITPETMQAALRDHGADGRPPQRGLLGATTCMHASLGPVRGSQTTGSLVARLSGQGPLAWATGTAAPCTGLFKPFWLDAGLADQEPAPAGVYDPATRFWRHERLHRAVLRDHGPRLALYRDERDALEARFVQEALALADTPAEERRAYTCACLAEADAATARWIEMVEQAPEPPRLAALPHRLAWRGWNKAAQMP